MVQDSVLGSYKITNDNTLINWRDFMNLITYLKGINYNIIEKGKDYSGKNYSPKLFL